MHNDVHAESLPKYLRSFLRLLAVGRLLCCVPGSKHPGWIELVALRTPGRPCWVDLLLAGLLGTVALSI